MAKDTTKPFRVVVNDMMVEALGTGFNINAYQDDNCLRTTLVEGKFGFHIRILVRNVFLCRASRLF